MEVLKIELTQAVKQSIDFRASGTKEEITACLCNYFANVIPKQKGFSEDVLSLLELFRQVTKTSSFRIILAAVDNNIVLGFTQVLINSGCYVPI
ncbi:hypothetical protein ABW636_09810 [Aquimarina sp. 2201CG1-2-11]|uniref:hypothetical protein n=1 Tax=Aquimarina discodermiae TaxID=3231043 RepID=UPI003462E176